MRSTLSVLRERAPVGPFRLAAYRDRPLAKAVGVARFPQAGRFTRRGKFARNCSTGLPDRAAWCTARPVRWPGLVMVCVALGCGSAKELPADHAKSASSSKRAKVSDDEPLQEVGTKKVLPWRCRKSKPPCMPPPTFVKRLCQDVYPDVALHMFRPGTPWRRFYLLHTAEPFNASGGASLLGDKMRRGEEVIALKRRNPRTGVQVSDIAGWDVLRWNGACATIHDGEFSTEPPREPGHARVEWRSLALEVRLALEAEPDFQELYEARRRACKGISVGRVTAECEEYDKKLADEIVRKVRAGTKLPKPTKIP